MGHCTVSPQFADFSLVFQIATNASHFSDSEVGAMAGHFRYSAVDLRTWLRFRITRHGLARLVGRLNRCAVVLEVCSILALGDRAVGDQPSEVRIFSTARVSVSEG